MRSISDIMSDVALILLIGWPMFWAFKAVVLWYWEWRTMTKSGYWFDCGFSGRGRYDPKWRDLQGKRPDVPSKRVIL
jgi:hypothetical protein